MSSQEQELIGKLLNPHNRRDFFKRTGTFDFSASALTVFLQICYMCVYYTLRHSPQPVTLDSDISSLRIGGDISTSSVQPEMIQVDLYVLLYILKDALVDASVYVPCYRTAYIFLCSALFVRRCSTLLSYREVPSHAQSRSGVIW